MLGLLFGYLPLPPRMNALSIIDSYPSDTSTGHPSIDHDLPAPPPPLSRSHHNFRLGATIDQCPAISQLQTGKRRWEIATTRINTIEYIRSRQQVQREFIENRHGGRERKFELPRHVFRSIVLGAIIRRSDRSRLIITTETLRPDEIFGTVMPMPV